MNKSFYFKLAGSNIKKNAKTYIPYILTCTITVAMYYIIRSLSLNEGLKRIIGAEVIRSTLALGCWVVAIFAVIFLFYTNSFLMKRRKKEFGLFNILGMEKKHLSKVIGFETLYIAFISLVLGIGAGILLDKAMYLVILKLLQADVTLGFYISSRAIFATLLLFCVIFLLIFLNSLRQIHLAKPIELLQGGNVGEREPKAKWLIALLGIACLAMGYYIAITTQNPVTALIYFFVAVVLVVIGTYLVFTAGSVAFLKLLRKNKKYYYKTKHFTSISGMIYRMKQNAVGLANICILSTMVLVMVSSTMSMMIGMEDTVRNRYPYDITLYSNEPSAERNQEVTGVVQEVLQKRQAQMTNEISYTYLSFSCLQVGDTFQTDTESNQLVLDNLCNLFFIPLSDYNRVMGQNKTLQNGEVLLYSNRTVFKPDTLHVFDRNYTIVGRPDNFIGNGILAANIASSHFIVVKDLEEIHHLYEGQKQAYGKNASEIKFCYGFDLDVDSETEVAIYKELQKTLKEKEFVGYTESRADGKSNFLVIYGGLFFLGIFLGTLFIMVTALIIYYKQISEGYDDKGRYEIMQKVGMSRLEVKRSIHSQILTVFFLPLVMAGIHTAAAFPLVLKILAVLNLMNTKLSIICTVVCFLLFTLLYSIIYTLTAKAYYRIISK